MWSNSICLDEAREMTEVSRWPKGSVQQTILMVATVMALGRAFTYGASVRSCIAKHGYCSHRPVMAVRANDQSGSWRTARKCVNKN